MAIRNRKIFGGKPVDSGMVELPSRSGGDLHLMDILDRFSEVTGFKVSILSDPRWYEGRPFADEVARKPVPGYVDTERRIAYVFTGNVHRPGSRVSDEEILSRLMNEVFRNVPFQDIFPDSKGAALQVWLGSALTPSCYGTYGQLFEQPAERNVGFVLNVSRRQKEGLDEFGSAMLSYLHFPPSVTLRERFPSAFLSGLSKMQYKGAAQDVEWAASGVRSALLSDVSGNIPVVSMKGDCYRLEGYPDVPVLVDSEALRNLRDRMKLPDIVFSERLASGLEEPLAAVKNMRTGKMQYLLDLGKDDFLVLSLENASRSVRRILSNRDTGGRTAVFGRFYPLSVGAVMRNIAAGGLEYVRTETGPYGTERRPLMAAIDKKIEAESLAGIRSAQSSQPLRSSVANIVNSFRNKKNFDENYDPVQAFVEKRDLYARELQKTLELKGAPEARPEPVKGFRLDDRLPKGLTSKASALKLGKAGVSTYGDLLRLGGHQLLRLTDLATVTKLENHLKDLGKTLFPRPLAVAPSVFSGLSPQRRKECMLKDFTTSVALLPSNLQSMSIPAPVGLDGEPILGSAGFHLAAKLASRYDEWGSTPVFVSSEYLMASGFKPRDGADPVNVVDEAGNAVSYYNVVDSDISLQQPDLFNLLVEKADLNGTEVSLYFKNILSSLTCYSGSGRRRDPSVPLSSGWQVLRDAYDSFGMSYTIRMGKDLVDAESKGVPYVFVSKENVDSLIASGRDDISVVPMDAGRKAVKVGNQAQELGDDGLYIVGKGGEAKVLIPYLFHSLFEESGKKKNLTVLKPGVRAKRGRGDI